MTQLIGSHSCQGAWRTLCTCFVAATVSLGCFGQSPAKEPAPLAAVRLDGTYFSRDGHRFISVGANWVPAVKAMQWPYQWDAASIEHDFARMHELGFNTVRLDLVWAWFEPRPGDYNPEAFEQLHFLITLANRYQIYLQPELFIGGEVGEAYWDVPYRQGRHPYTDPDMLRLQTDYAIEMGKRFAKDNAILSWDLTDEPPFWIVSSTTSDSMAINWTRLIAGALRKYDQKHLMVVGTATQDINHGPFRPDNLTQDVDFFSVHPYTIYEPKLFPDSMVSVRGTYGSAFTTALTEGAGHPAMVQELGASSAQYTPEKIAQYLQANFYSSLGQGANGFLVWCYTDAAPAQYAKVPYLRSPHETQFGVTTWDGKERPSAQVMREFEGVTGKLDLAGIEPAPAEAAIVVPNEWSKPHGDESHFGLTGPEIAPYTSEKEGGAVVGQPATDWSEANALITGSWLSSFILARESGIKTAFPREYADWQKYRMVLLPAPLTGTDQILTHVHSDFWEKARAYVEQGGLVYASVSGNSAIPEMQTLFGARLKDRIPPRDVTLKVVAAFGSLQPGDTFHFAPSSDSVDQWPATLDIVGGTVVAVDQDGRPALVANSVGKGKTLLSAYPIETYLAAKPAAFDTDEPAYRIYQAFREWGGLAPEFLSSDPLVEVSSLTAKDHGYAVVVNHASTARKVTITATSKPGSVQRLVATGTDRKTPLSNGAWTVELLPYEGAVFSWK
jgi:endo-1,4-beta-mannosidase